MKKLLAMLLAFGMFLSPSLYGAPQAFADEEEDSLEAQLEAEDQEAEEEYDEAAEEAVDELVEELEDGATGDTDEEEEELDELLDADEEELDDLLTDGALDTQFAEVFIHDGRKGVIKKIRGAVKENRKNRRDMMMIYGRLRRAARKADLPTRDELQDMTEEERKAVLSEFFESMGDERGKFLKRKRKKKVRKCLKNADECQEKLDERREKRDMRRDNRQDKALDRCDDRETPENCKERLNKLFDKTDERRMERRDKVDDLIENCRDAGREDCKDHAKELRDEVREDKKNRKEFRMQLRERRDGEREEVERASRTCPEGRMIKGNVSQNTNEKIYHVPGGQFYDETVIGDEVGEKCFSSSDEAERAGFRSSLR
jgi:hypothetical protein